MQQDFKCAGTVAVAMHMHLSDSTGSMPRRPHGLTVNLQHAAQSIPQVTEPCMLPATAMPLTLKCNIACGVHAEQLAATRTLQLGYDV